MTIQKNFPLTWLFHRNSSRWAYNMLTKHEADIPEPGLEYPLDSWLPLPSPQWPIIAVEEAFRLRCSCRHFAKDGLDIASLASVLSAGYGTFGRNHRSGLEFIERPVPSGGGLYPLEIYLVVVRVDGLASGVYHYHPVAHGLELRREVQIPGPLLEYLFMGQGYATAAPVLLVISAVFSRSMGKYGDRGYRYLLLEAGHVMQNVNLMASAMGLGSCNLGGFFDDQLADLLRLQGDQEWPLYATALGWPALRDREALRNPAAST